MSTEPTPGPARPDSSEHLPARRPGTFSRRQVLAGLGVATGTAVAAAYGVSVWGRRGDGSATADAAARAVEVGSGVEGRTLVVLELAGGNDSLSTVVPHSDPRYRDLRPTLAVDDPLDLDGQIGLHPGLVTLAQRWEAGDLAVVEGIGYPEPDLSHFASLVVWWTGDPDAVGGAGWLGRYLDAVVGFDDPLAGITIGPAPSPALAGDASFAASIAGPAGLQPSLDLDAEVREALIAQWSRMAGGPAVGDGADDVREAVVRTVEARDRLGEMLGDSYDAGADQTGRLARRGPRARADLATSLEIAARLIASDTPPRVVWVPAGGDFDTHQGQANRHPALMEQIDGAIGAYLATLEDLGVADRAVLMTTSEFGRRAGENGTGTDHGTAAAHLVVGAGVAGGRYGEPPSLRDLDESGNLVHTVDYRTYYASVLEGWLGVESGPIVGEHETIDLFV